MRSRFVAVWVGGFLLFIISAAPHAQTAAWKPDRNVELVVGVSPGGGMDKIARLVQQNLQLQRLTGTNSTVVNKPGGGGTIALNYLQQHAGDPHYLGVFSIGLITNQITGLTPINHTEVTPIALLISEYVGFALNAASPLRGTSDVIQRLRKDPGSMSISFASSRGNANHLAIVLVMKAAGVDHKLLRTPVYNSAGEATVALLGGHVDMAASGIANFIPHFQAGKLRPLAISGPRRLDGALAEVPTWKEQGIDVVMANWYVLVAPKGLGASQVAYWEDMARKVTQSEGWQKTLREQTWEMNNPAASRGVSKPKTTAKCAPQGAGNWTRRDQNQRQRQSARPKGRGIGPGEIQAFSMRLPPGAIWPPSTMSSGPRSSISTSRNSLAKAIIHRTSAVTIPSNSLRMDGRDSNRETLSSRTR